jgi:hypothetical protein
MTDHAESVVDGRRPPFPLLPAGVVVGLLIFVGTYFTYFYRHQTHAHGSYIPLAVGIGTFFCVMLGLNYLALASRPAPARLAMASGAAIAESLAFLVLIMFVVVNTRGSCVLAPCCPTLRSSGRTPALHTSLFP